MDGLEAAIVLERENVLCDLAGGEDDAAAVVVKGRGGGRHTQEAQRGRDNGQELHHRRIDTEMVKGV